MTQQALTASQIAVAPAASGELDAAILASATVEATPDAGADRARARHGQPDHGPHRRSGARRPDPCAGREPRCFADRGRPLGRVARVTLAARQLERERGLLAQGDTARRL
jgi:cobalt-zinc-cadmium efflux system membrane fusion protein